MFLSFNYFLGMPNMVVSDSTEEFRAEPVLRVNKTPKDATLCRQYRRECEWLRNVSGVLSVIVAGLVSMFRN
jgi:hypothetical protein